MQPAEVVLYPTVTDGVPGYNPPPGSGYHALRNGSVVFVRTPRHTEDGAVCAPSTSQQIIPAAPAVATKGALTQKGPPVKGWSWKVVRNKAISKERVATLAENQPTTSTALANSFACLAVDTPSIEDSKGGK